MLYNGKSVNTKSSKRLCLALPLDIYNAMEAHAIASKRTVLWHVRQACIAYLANNGYSTAGFYNPGPRERIDLKIVPAGAFERAAKKARNQSPSPGKSESA